VMWMTASPLTGCYNHDHDDDYDDDDDDFNPLYVHNKISL